jgi:hypothetical protein
MGRAHLPPYGKTSAYVFLWTQHKLICNFKRNLDEKFLSEHPINSSAHSPNEFLLNWKLQELVHFAIHFKWKSTTKRSKIHCWSSQICNKEYLLLIVYSFTNFWNNISWWTNTNLCPLSPGNWPNSHHFLAHFPAVLGSYLFATSWSVANEGFLFYFLVYISPKCKPVPIVPPCSFLSK